MAPEAMKVGELARRTGLSVRTLHHYDDIGLLTPAGRTPSGHRIYGMAEVRRLQQIASLRHWAELFDAFARAMERDVDPASTEVQALAARAADLIEQFTGGDPGIRASVTRMYREEGGENIMASHGTRLPAGLWEYYGRALAVRGESP